MKIPCLMLLLFMCCPALRAQEPWNKLVIDELAPGYYIFTTYKMLGETVFPSNGLYVVGDSGVVMIDTPWNESQFQPLLDSIERRHGKKVLFCLSTHFHDDRTAGLEYYASKGIATWSSKKTYKLCEEREEKKAEHRFKKDTLFRISGVGLETYYPGPGHAPDNIVVYFPSKKLLYGGCFVKSLENNSLGYISDADLKSWKKGLLRVMERYPGITQVVPGHFAWSDAANGRELFFHTLNLLKTH